MKNDHQIILACRSSIDEQWIFYDKTNHITNDIANAKGFDTTQTATSFARRVYGCSAFAYDEAHGKKASNTVKALFFIGPRADDLASFQPTIRIVVKASKAAEETRIAGLRFGHQHVLS